MLKHFFILLCVLTVISAVDDTLRAEWKSYKNTFNKKYRDPVHEENRYLF